jgi:hypothetical protein
MQDMKIIIAVRAKEFTMKVEIAHDMDSVFLS